MEPQAPPTQRSLWRRIAAGVGRFLLADLLACPVFMVFAVAAMPFAFKSFPMAVYLARSEEEMVGMVVHRVLWVGGIAFALAHLPAIPWVVGRDPRRGKRFFFVTLGIGCAAAVVIGAGAWLWLVLS